MMTLGSSSKAGYLAGCDTRRRPGPVLPYGDDRKHSYSQLRANFCGDDRVQVRAPQCLLLAQSGHAAHTGGGHSVSWTECRLLTQSGDFVAKFCWDAQRCSRSEITHNYFGTRPFVAFARAL
jgi:hypothetical protein